MWNGMEIDEHGTREWWLNDRRHREDGPAREWADGTKEWYRDGLLHREDGPAVEWADEIQEWWLWSNCLGEGGEGFWALWDRLTNEQRANPTLLRHLPR